MTALPHLAPSHTAVSQSSTLSASPAVTTALPNTEPAVYWGDKVALQVWFLGSVLLWMLSLSNLLANLWTR